MRFIRHLRWLPDTQKMIGQATGGLVRILSDSDTSALRQLISVDPVTNCYPQSLLDSGREAGPLRTPDRGLFFGVDKNPSDPTEGLRAAVWVGSNIVPIEADEDTGALFGRAAATLRRRFGSIFGPAEPVRGIWSTLSQASYQAREVRWNQPLLTINEPSSVTADPDVRLARPEDYADVYPASVSMFTEELGYSPLIDGAAGYQMRVAKLLERGHCAVKIADVMREPAPEPPALQFKADFGVVTTDTVQIQGVWIPPELRGRGQAASLMAATVDLALQRAPVVSLYVNDFNEPALRTYHRVGFQQRGTFATVLCR